MKNNKSPGDVIHTMVTIRDKKESNCSYTTECKSWSWQNRKAGNLRSHGSDGKVEKI